MNIFNLFSRKEPIKTAFSIEVVDEKRIWYKNGNHQLYQKLAFIDENGNKIGEGKIRKKLTLKS